MSLSGPSFEPRHGGPMRQIVVLLHGVGANGQDLIALAPMFARHLPEAAFHAPDAPFPSDMAPFGRQWFSLQDRRPALLLAGLQRLQPLLQDYVEALLQRYGLGGRQLALVGFSQGTMTALHVGPRLADAPACILGYSGALVSGERLEDEASAKPPVMLIHGEQDEVVPAEALPLARRQLQVAGFEVRSLTRPGLGHGIDPEGVEAGGRFLAEHLLRSAGED